MPRERSAADLFVESARRLRARHEELEAQLVALRRRNGELESELAARAEAFAAEEDALRRMAAELGTMDTELRASLAGLPSPTPAARPTGSTRPSRPSTTRVAAARRASRATTATRARATRAGRRTTQTAAKAVSQAAAREVSLRGRAAAPATSGGAAPRAGKRHADLDFVFEHLKGRKGITGGEAAEILKTAARAAGRGSEYADISGRYLRGWLEAIGATYHYTASGAPFWGSRDEKRDAVASGVAAERKERGQAIWTVPAKKPAKMLVSAAA